MATQAQIDANRRNAALSTGPRTPEGKSASKMNRTIHGLRAESVVLPTEDPAAFQAHVEEWLADWNPQSAASRELVEEAASAAWRKRRCVRVESARLSERAQKALRAWDARRDARLDEHVAALPDDPAGALDALMATRAGVDRLIGFWTAIADAARAPGGWSDFRAHHLRFVHLHGLCPGDDGAEATRDLSFRLLLVARPEYADASDPSEPTPFPPAEAEAARSAIVAEAEARLAWLRAARERARDDSAARLADAERRAFEPQPEDAPLQRYEGQLHRQFHKALEALVKRSKAEAEPPTAPAPTGPEPAVAGSVPSPGGDAPTPEIGFGRRRRGRGGAGQPERDRSGRTWAVGETPEVPNRPPSHS